MTSKGFGDQLKTSQGINAKLGGKNAPTVINSGYHTLQFWDGRAASLEAQAQGPVGNNVEMFSGPGEPWDEAISRLRRNPEYVKLFLEVFGHQPTKDAAAKAIAAYERTVLSGNSVQDRAEVQQRRRVAEDELEKPELQAIDYLVVLKAAQAKKDLPALSALGLTADSDPATLETIANQLVNGRNLYFGKARCSTCHIGENYTDNQFHNLGIGAKNGILPESEYGRWAAQPTGHKDPAVIGAFKTPGLRAILNTQPYMHDGSESTLEAVVELYDRGGNVNEFLDPKMRDSNAEEAYRKAIAAGQKPTLPAGAMLTRAGQPVIPLKLNLTAREKADLVLFLKALQGDPLPAIIADPERLAIPQKLAGR